MARDGGAADDVGALIRERMQEQGLSVARLAALVAEREGLSKLTTGAVYKWLAEPAILAPARLFAIEEILNVPPGTYSRALGYVPVATVPGPPTIAEALRNETDLTDRDREIIASVIDAARRTRRGQRQRRAPHRDGSRERSPQ